MVYLLAPGEGFGFRLVGGALGGGGQFGGLVVGAGGLDGVWTENRIWFSFYRIQGDFDRVEIL